MVFSCFGLCCRSPNPDAVVVMHTPSGVFAARNVLQNVNDCPRGSRLISSKNAELPESPALDTNDFDACSAARCRVFTKSNFKVGFRESCDLLSFIFYISNIFQFSLLIFIYFLKPFHILLDKSEAIDFM